MRAVAAIVAVGAAAAPIATALADTSDLSQLSLEQLADLEVTSVSKSPEPLQQAPATIYVITHDDIVRSGATSIPEALRLAPNLQITQLTASNYVAAARGFAGNPPDQNFSNKLLILIDGRSVYSPLYSGVYLDAQDVMLEDVDRIEVISGPGATLWGANAVNGVINIITRPAYLTGGTLVSAAAGNLEQDLSARYGGKIDEDTTFRVYGKTFDRDSLEEPDGGSAHDDWYKAQAGFRMDRSLADDTFTLQGDTYRQLENNDNQGSGMLSGGNILGRWQHHSDSSDIQLQAYFDQFEDYAPPGGPSQVLHTWDVEFQQTAGLGSFQKVVWGAGERLYAYSIADSYDFLLDPERRNLTLGNVFGQDTLSLGAAVKLIGGVKFEDDPYAGWQLQPNLRLAWALAPTAQLWTAASKAVRSPTPFDTDVVEKLGGAVYLQGNPAFRPERVTAYEVGYRGQPTDTFSFSASVYYNVYDDLRSIDTTPISLLPLYWGNGMEGHTYGVEAWAQWQVLGWWRLSPGIRTLHKDLTFGPGAVTLLGVAQSGDDPSSQALLTSSMDLGARFTFDATVRYVGALPDPALPSYTEMNCRLGWQVSKALELALTGSNLLHARHQEFPAPDGEEIPRSFMVQAQWRP